MSLCATLLGCGVYPQSILLKNPLFILRVRPGPDEGTNGGAVENHRRFSVHGEPFDFAQNTLGRSISMFFSRILFSTIFAERAFTQQSLTILPDCAAV